MVSKDAHTLTAWLALSHMTGPYRSRPWHCRRMVAASSCLLSSARRSHDSQGRASEQASYSTTGAINSRPLIVGSKSIKHETLICIPVKQAFARAIEARPSLCSALSTRHDDMPLLVLPMWDVRLCNGPSWKRSCLGPLEAGNKGKMALEDEGMPASGSCVEEKAGKLDGSPAACFLL